MSIPIPTQHRKSLDASWKEGIAASIMIAVTDYYFIPLALFLGAGPRQIGWLVAIPHLLGSFSQIFAANLVTKVTSRVRFLTQGACVQAALLLPIAVLPFLGNGRRVYALILAVIVFRVLGNLIGTVWGSLVSSYLTPEERGAYLGWRGKISGFAGIVGLAIGGLLLAALKVFSISFAFFVVFLLPVAARFASTFWMARMEDVPVGPGGPDARFSLIDFLRRFRESNFVKFVFYVALMTFSTQVASPYFSVYMLKNLHFTYVQYMLMHLAAVVSGLMAFPIWGRHADRVGNAQVMKLTGLIVPMIPLLWLMTREFYLLIVVELFAGFMWSGFNLCSVNFIFDAVVPEKRMRCLSYFNLINGTAIFLGASLGGYLAEHLPPLWGYKLYGVFLLSSALRYGSHFILSGGFKEVRGTVERITSRDLFFSVLGIRPVVGRDRV
ncbi:MAG: MFS transporter [Candidatus Omnitrophica bacterium]|nr:MFS transporter [Candidatus Omnitrophota bacterium]